MRFELEGKVSQGRKPEVGKGKQKSFFPKNSRKKIRRSVKIATS